MKVYLSQNHNSHHHASSNKTELERIKSKLIKNTAKHKNPQTQINIKNINVHSSVSNRSKSSKKQQGQITVKLLKQHTRTHTDSEVHIKSQEGKTQGELNKTYSKNRLKTESSNCNAETIRVIKKQKKPIENQDNFITSIVKDRLNQEKKNKRAENPCVKRIIELTAMAKHNKNTASTEYSKYDIAQSKANGKEIEATFENLYTEMQKQELTEREDALCELIQVLMKKAKHGEVGEGERLLKVVRELQQKNVRLMNLVNYMKRKGVDVDFFWNSSNLS